MPRIELRSQPKLAVPPAPPRRYCLGVSAEIMNAEAPSATHSYRHGRAIDRVGRSCRARDLDPRPPPCVCRLASPCSSSKHRPAGIAEHIASRCRRAAKRFMIELTIAPSETRARRSLNGLGSPTAAWDRGTNNRALRACASTAISCAEPCDRIVEPPRTHPAGRDSCEPRRRQASAAIR